MDVQLTLTVNVPQLDTLNTLLQQFGGQLVELADSLTQEVASLKATLDAHLVELQTVLQSDMAEETKIQAAITQLQGIRTTLAQAIPDVPPAPAPTPASEPEPTEPPPAG